MKEKHYFIKSRQLPGLKIGNRNASTNRGTGGFRFIILEKILKFNVTRSAISCILNAVSLQIQGLFSRTFKNQGLFKDPQNSRTFQGPLNFKDFSRPVGTLQIIGKKINQLKCKWGRGWETRMDVRTEAVCGSA